MTARRCYGTSDFDGLHSGKYDEEAQLYAFDILALDGDDLRKLPLPLRKQKLARLLKRLRTGFSLRLPPPRRSSTKPFVPAAEV